MLTVCVSYVYLDVSALVFPSYALKFPLVALSLPLYLAFSRSLPLWFNKVRVRIRARVGNPLLTCSRSIASVLHTTERWNAMWLQVGHGPVTV